MVNDMCELPEEEWRAVPSYPALEASSHGRLRIIPFEGKMPCGTPRMYGGRPSFGQVMSATKEARSLFFSFMHRKKNIKVHFAVCEAFNGKNVERKNGVRHLNENGLDNRPGNLVWASAKVNLNDPVIKKFHYNRVSPFFVGDMTPEQKRAGIHDNIRDIAVFQLAMRAANDNERLVLVAGGRPFSQGGMPLLAA